MSKSKQDKPQPPIPEEMLDKGIELLEGPVNRAAERALGSRVVLAPLSLSMNLGLRLLARVRPRSQR